MPCPPLPAGRPPARPVRVPPNLFAIPFGLTGLAGCWLITAIHGPVSRSVADVLFVAGAAVWVVVLVAYIGALRPLVGLWGEISQTGGPARASVGRADTHACRCVVRAPRAPGVCWSTSTPA
jgi:hypothetical protein